jgi:hypothetical protein
MTPDPYAPPDAAPLPADPVNLVGLDWIGLGVACLLIVRLLAFAFGGWRTMFRDFGSLDELPWLTRIILGWWAPPALALPAIAALVMFYRRRRQQAERRRWLLAAVVLSFVGLAVCIVAIYLPVFSLAGKLEAG